MKQRRLVKAKIIEAWDKVILTDYQAKRITSERALQASLWASLNESFGANRKIFIEPFLSVKGRQIYPDLVICNNRSVIAVIELKYLPRTAPRYLKDIENLALVAKHRTTVAMSDVRYRGAGHRVKVYPFAKHVLFVWAGVHAKTKNLSPYLYSEGHSSLHECFMELHAETTKNDIPSVFYRD